MKYLCKYVILLSMFTFGRGNYDTFSSRKLLTDWCSLKCGNNPNTACGNCKYKSPCANYVVDREELVKVHNELRNQFAAGEDKRAGNITVANMHVLSWDNDLAYVADCHLAQLQCNDFRHDVCRITSKFHSVGQNLYKSSQIKKEATCSDLERPGVQGWYEEIKHLTPEDIKATGQSFSLRQGTGHFTQMTWAEMTHVGCVMSRSYVPGGDTNCILACNYGPSGNVNDVGMFKEGKPCSQCPEGVPCGTTYKNLCGNVEPMSRMAHVYPNHTVILILLLLAYKSLIF